MKAKVRCTNITTGQDARLHRSLMDALASQDNALDATAAIRAEYAITPALLDTGMISRYAFSPLWDSGQPGISASQVQADFYQSARHLKTLYGFDPTPTGHLPFPYNIQAEYRRIKKLLKSAARHLSLMITWTAQGKATLATYQIYNSGRYVYFLEIAKLWTYLQQHGQDESAGLLLSIFSYLVKVVRMPYYSVQGSNFYDEYAMAYDGIVADNYNDEQECIRIESHYDHIMDAGNCLLDILMEPCHLDQFAARVWQGQRSGKVKGALLALAGRAFDLFTRFPATSLYDGHFSNNTGEDDEYENTIMFRQYFSIVWDCGNCLLYDYIKESLNCDYGEKMYTQEPMTIQFFDSPQSCITTDLSFASGVMDLVADLIYFLNKQL